MLVTSQIKMDLLRPNNPARINTVQGDCNTRSIAVSLFAGDVPWPVPSGVTVALRYCKPDQTGGCYDSLPDGAAAWNIQDNVITMLLAPQLLTVPGIVSAQLELTQQNKILATYPIYIVVENNFAEGLNDSENYVNLRQWMRGEMDSWLENARDNGQLDGETGKPAILQSSSVHYQVSNSGTEYPVGEWFSHVPEVVPGKFLWIRTTFVFNTGDPVVTYSVSRFGADGEQASEPVSTTVISAVLAADGWSASAPYTQSLQVAGLSETLHVRAYPDWPEDNALEVALAQETAKVNSCKRSGSTITFKCREEKPGMDIPVIVEVYA